MWKRFSIIGRERHGGEEKSYVQGVHYPVGFERYKRDLDTGKSASSYEILASNRSSSVTIRGLV